MKQPRDQKGAVVMEAESSSVGKGAGAMSRSRKHGGKGRREPHRVMAPKATCLLSHSRISYKVKMGDRSVYHENTSLVIPIQKIVVHPQFSSATVVKNDIALLKLQHPVNFTSQIHPICIPPENFFLETGTKCWVTGWGKKDPGSKIWCSGRLVALFLQ